jgi:hypothetical protein
MTCPQHVWIIICSANTAAQKRNQLLDLIDDEASARRKAAKEGGVGSDAWLWMEERATYGNLMIAVRPCETSLLADRCTNLVWIPWRSLSVSQRQHPIRMPDHKIPDDRRAFMEQNGPAIHPNMHVQVLDIAAVKRKKVTANISSTGSVNASVDGSLAPSDTGSESRNALRVDANAEIALPKRASFVDKAPVEATSSAAVADNDGAVVTGSGASSRRASGGYSNYGFS